MSDLIPRDKAIECIWKPKVKPDAEIFNALKMAIQSEIEQLPIVTPESGWISVKDRLPNCNGIYLVWRPHYFGGEIGEPVVCYFDGQNTWHDSYGVDFERILNPDDVTHWMPLPEPPKEETK